MARLRARPRTVPMGIGEWQKSSRKQRMVRERRVARASGRLGTTRGQGGGASRNGAARAAGRGSAGRAVGMGALGGLAWEGPNDGTLVVILGGWVAARDGWVAAREGSHNHWVCGWSGGAGPSGVHCQALSRNAVDASLPFDPDPSPPASCLVACLALRQRGQGQDAVRGGHKGQGWRGSRAGSASRVGPHLRAVSDPLPVPAVASAADGGLALTALAWPRAAGPGEGDGAARPALPWGSPWAVDVPLLLEDM